MPKSKAKNQAAVEPTELKASHSAKVAALKNAVWLQSTGTGNSQGATTRKRGRVPSTPAQAAKSNKKARKGAEPSNLKAVEPETTKNAESVDIPPLVPMAPRKPRKTPSVVKGVRSKLEPIRLVLDSKHDAEDSVTEQETESSVTEQETEGSVTEQETDSDTDGQGETVPLLSEKAVVVAVAKAVVASKQRLDEQPTWSPPASGSSKMRNHVIVQNHIIEISDDGSDMEITPSSTPGLGATQGQALIAGESSTTDMVEFSSDSDESYHGEDNTWLEFTNIVHHGRELSLGQQSFEVKLVVRKVMGYMLEYLLFRNGFPCLAVMR